MAIINEGTIAKLRRLAASWQVFNIKMHQYHYNVVGETFDELHKLFKELYEEADAHYDAVSERMRQIGERVVFSCAELAEQSAVNDENNANTPQEMLRGTIDAFAALSSLQTEIWFESDDQKDIATNDLMVQLNKAVEFKNWMVSAQLGREVEPVK